MDPIKFTGEFDPTEITKGIDAMIGALERAAVREKELGKNIELTDQSRKESEDGLKKMQATIAGLDKTSKDYAATNATLTSRMKALQGQYDKYTTTIEKQQKELTELQVVNAKMKKGYEDSTKALETLQKTAGKPIAPALNDTKITQQIGGITDKLKGAGQSIANTFNSSAPAIENVGNTVESVGQGFGPMGAAAGFALAIIVKGLYDVVFAETEAEKTTKMLNETFKANSAATAQASSDVDTLKIRFDLAKDGLLNKDEVLKQYNDTLGKTLGVTKDFNEAEQLLIDNAETYIKIVGLKAQAQALANIKIAESEKKANALLGFDDNRNTSTQVADVASSFELSDLLSPITTLLRRDELSKEIDDKAAASKARFNTNIANDAAERIEAISKMELDIQKKLAELSYPFKDSPKEFKKERAAIVNIYVQELQKIREDLAKLDKSEFTNDETITKVIEEQFNKRELALEKAFAKKQLTRSQLGSLKDNLGGLEQLTLEKELKDFGEKRAAFVQKIEDAISSVQIEESLKRVSLIKDDFERQRQTIEIESDKTVEALGRRQEKTIADLKRDAAKNGFTPEQLDVEIAKITDAYSRLLEDIENIKQQKLQKLSFDTFEQLANDANRTFASQAVDLSTGTVTKIRNQADLYQSGTITYKAYQKALTQIAKDEATARFVIERDRLTLQIRLREARLATDKTLTDAQVRQLQDEISKLKAQLADAEKGNLASDKGPKPDDATQQKIKQVNEYASAIGNLANEVIGFWASMNEAEEKALDRSIALQEKRVDAARRLAERGNAEYLRLEEDRLKDLEVKRENNARRQMAVNAALQASQVLTALISGIAYGAQQGGAIGAIAGLAAIVAAIAGGYAIVKSLQPDQPSFFVGTEDTGPGGKSDNKGGFQAVLHPHERVMTREQNKKLKGLTNDQVVTLVEKSKHFIEYNYPSKLLPQPNMASIDMANTVSATQNVRLTGIMEDNNRKLDESIVWQKKVYKRLGEMGMSVSLDKNGFAASWMEEVDQIEKDKKA